MKTGFHDPIKVKEGKKMKAPWNFDQPQYDERSSCYVNAGSHYGVGHNQPVGSEGRAKAESPCLPKGRVNTMKDDQTSFRNLRFEVES